MSMIAIALIVLVALLHVYFFVLEMFLWTKPQGMKVFRNTPEKAEITKVLAANQGLYNGFLAVGLLWAAFAGKAAAVQNGIARALQRAPGLVGYWTRTSPPRSTPCRSFSRFSIPARASRSSSGRG